MSKNAYMLFSLFIAVMIFSGCGLRYQGETATYIAGYEAGQAAANKFIVGIAAGILNGPDAYLYGISEPPIPAPALKKIENRPAEYQRGFIEGYRESIESDAWLFGTLLEL